MSRENPTLPESYALLVNARAEKGFDLVLRVAALCPDIPFVAIASQSARSKALDDVARSGLRNVTIADRTDDMDSLYKGAKVVLVPSYRFLETFSRVCIEAQRHGKPVLGSDRGNVPNLLKDSGTVLPEEPEAWAAQLRRLYDDNAAWRAAAAAALENSARYSKAGQARAFDQVVAAARQPLLVGIGSGIGNMLHTGPMLRNIACRLGRPVDLVVAEDHSETLFLLQRAPWVQTVHTLHGPILNRHYETVFLTHCFGNTQVPFACDRLLRSRDWSRFQPGVSAHETVFNLEAAKALLGIDYDTNDVERHYVGAADHIWTDGPVVGLHGGSKPGYWASKRWPGFPELATRLKERGFRVASFGTPGEWVEGAEDHTGGSVEEMVEKMRICSWFVSNDSGVMNIANALGIPVLSLFAPTDVATRAPLAARNRVVAARGDCVPCEVHNRKAFKSGHCACISRIEVDEVLAAFDDMRARMGATPLPQGALL